MERGLKGNRCGQLEGKREEGGEATPERSDGIIGPTTGAGTWNKKPRSSHLVAG
jgi:hypothetical protein